jgi:hypothetical protein
MLRELSGGHKKRVKGSALFFLIVRETLKTAQNLYGAMATRPDKESDARDAGSSESGGPASPSFGAVSTSIGFPTRRRQGGQSGMRSRLAAHPMLLGCLFVLQGYAQLQPMGSVRDLFLDLTAVVGAIFVLQLAIACFVPYPRKPALLASLCVLFFCFFEGWRLLLGEWTLGTRWVWLVRARWLIPMEGTVFLALCVWVLRTPRALVTTRRYLDVVSILLVALALVSVFRAPPPRVFRPGALADVPLAVGEHPPDIYYILTDAYTSPESLKAFWGYDDAAFVNYLTGLGFHVLKNAHSNATVTPISLATSLNMDYPPAPGPYSYQPSELAFYCRIILQAEAPSRLKASGYDVRAFSIFDVAGAPRYYHFPKVSDPTLSSVLLDLTVLGILRSYRDRVSFGDTNLKLFSLLPEIAAERSAKPKFVYVHVMMPHLPYLFDEKGRRIRRGLLPGDDRPEDYLGQLIYANTLITNAVAGILKNSKTPPIIIVQGDHGYRSLPGPHRSEEAPTILNALYLPGSEADWLYPGLTPVNTFRVIFNHYFGQHYSYLPDIVPSPSSPFANVPDDK